MAAALEKGFLQGPAGCPPTFLSARKPQIANFVTCFPRNHPRRRLNSQSQELDWIVRSSKPLFSDASFVDPQAPTSYIDVLNMSKLRHPMSQQQKLMHEESEHCEKTLHQCARNFVDGIIQFISSEKDYYMFIIIACKENTNLIMELGFISSYNQDDILKGLGRIEDDIAKGRFEWRENKDVRINIIEALVERVGEPARKLDATISQYVQNLTILRLWFHDSADTIVTLIEQLQVELVLLALRNWGFVVPLLFRPTDWILLGESILSKIKLLEMDVSRLRSCKNKIDSTLRISFPLCSAVGGLDRFLTPHVGVRESFSLLDKHVSDLSKLTTIRKGFTCYYNIQEQDTCQRFLAVYRIVQQILKAATDFAKNVHFDHKKVQSFPSVGYVKTGSSDIHMVKLSYEDQSGEKKDEGARATREFKSRSDEVMKELVDWLAKHQTGENPLKFSQFEFDE